MRTIRFSLAAGALLLPLIASAANPVVGLTVDPGCTAPTSEPGELIVTKLTPTASDQRDDLLFDLRAKGGLQSDGGTSFAGGGWGADPNWRISQADTDVHYAIVTFPPLGPGQAGRLSIDSATASEFDAGIARIQTVGNSIPSGSPGFNSIGLTVPGSSGTFSVTLRPTVTKSFPAGSTSNGINIAFAPLIDVNDADPSGSTCMWGAKHADPQDTTDGSPTRGAIIGYNIYRIPGTSASVPSPADFKTALSDANPASGWVGFIDVRTLHQGIADTNPPAVGTPSPVEVASASDIGGMQNPNGIPYDADEVMIFQDSPDSTRSRPGGAALQPNLTQSYWYAEQPVIAGKVSEFQQSGWTNNDFMSGEHRCDLDGDGLFDGVDLDTINCTGIATIDFISPQAEFGIDGLGLTNGSLPLLSAPMFFNAATAVLPAVGGVSVVGTVTGSDVSLRLSTGLESRSIAGYNVYRQVGAQRVRVNEQPILAQGSESNVYSLLDTAVSSARGAHAVSVQYMVETVYSDGTASTFAGPFTVELQAQQPARRRR